MKNNTIPDIGQYYEEIKQDDVVQSIEGRQVPLD